MVFISIQHVYFSLYRLGLTWLMVYRTEKYQKLKAEVEKQSKKREFFLRYALYIKIMTISTCLFLSFSGEKKRGTW